MTGPVSNPITLRDSIGGDPVTVTSDRDRWVIVGTGPANRRTEVRLSPTVALLLARRLEHEADAVTEAQR